MVELSLQIYVFLIAAAFCAGFIDSIAGGGGLLTVPALLLAGLPPVEALATNKLQGSFGAATALVNYTRGGHVRPQDQLGMAAIAALASIFGAFLARLVPADILRVVMPVILIGVALFFALRRGLSDTDRVVRMRPAIFAVTLVPLVAAYDGFFGPGAGAFYMVGFVLLAGQGVLRATAHTKLLNLSSNIGSFLVFIPSGAVHWGLGFAMAAAQIGGATLGARLAMRIGAGLIRPLLVVVSVAMALRLLWQAWA